MSEHTKDTLFRFHKEDEYGGGMSADTEYLKTAPTLWAQLEIIAPFIMGEQPMPYCEFEREEVRAAGDDEHAVHVFNKNRIKKDSTNKFYFHNHVFLESAISASAGQAGDSYLSHYEKPEGEFDAFGLVVQEYSFEFGGAGEFPSESIKWHYYDVAEGSAIVPPVAASGTAGETAGSSIFTDTGSFGADVGIGDILVIEEGTDIGEWVILAVATDTVTVDGTFSGTETTLAWSTRPQIFLTTHPLTMADISLKIGVDGGALVAKDIKACSFTITNEFEEVVPAGQWTAKKPALKNRSVSLDLTFQSVSPISGLIDNTRTEELADLHIFELTLGSKAVTFTSMRVVEGNVEKIPEFGFYEYTLTLNIGESFGIAVA